MRVLFCLLAMHTVDSSTRVESVSSKEPALSIQNIYTTIYYSHHRYHDYLSLWI